MNNKKIIIDLDGTLTLADTKNYEEVRPNLEVIKKLREYKELGYEIVIHTARNMQTFGSNLGKINAVTVPIILTWLRKHEVPYDEIIVGKPWCGEQGFYVDDKAIRPSEFMNYNTDEINNILKRETPFS